MITAQKFLMNRVDLNGGMCTAARVANRVLIHLGSEEIILQHCSEIYLEEFFTELFEREAQIPLSNHGLERLTTLRDTMTVTAFIRSQK